MTSAGFLFQVSRICPAHGYNISLPHPVIMQQFIASYLFQNKNCPLPGIGSLFIQTEGAQADFTNHLVNAPTQSIQFSDKEINAAGLMNYVAERTRFTEEEVTESLRNFSAALKDRITHHAKAELPGIGNFFIDENGNTIFEQENLPPPFMAPVTANRVIHPNAEHSMLVGDKETTNTMMTEYFSEEAEVKDRWWIWAIALAALALLAFLLYQGSSNGASYFGNSIKL